MSALNEIAPPEVEAEWQADLDAYEADLRANLTAFLDARSASEDASKAAPAKPSFTAFYARLNALIAEYHEALCVALGVDPALARKADDGLESDLNALAEKYYELALELGIDAAESILKTQVSAGMAQKLTDYLEAELDSNNEYLTTSLIPALAPEEPADAEVTAEGEDAAPDEGLSGKALVDRAGLYADQLYGIANTGLIKPLTSAGLVMEWILDPGADHCEGDGSCPELAAGGPYSDPDGSDDSEFPPLPTYPGVDTICMMRCRCTVAITNESWNAYNAAQDAEKGWVTLNGAHVLIGDDGTIQKGPAHLVGTKPGDAGGTRSAVRAPRFADLHEAQTWAEANLVDGSASLTKRAAPEWLAPGLEVEIVPPTLATAQAVIDTIASRLGHDGMPDRLRSLSFGRVMADGVDQECEATTTMRAGGVDMSFDTARVQLSDEAFTALKADQRLGRGVDPSVVVRASTNARDYLENTVVHEMGHALNNAYNQSVYGSHEDYSPTQDALFAHYTNPKVLPGYNLGEYSRQNKNEFFAEAYTEMQVGRGKVSADVRAFMDNVQAGKKAE